MSDKESTEEQSEKLFIQGYQVFCNEAGQPDSANNARPSNDSPTEKDPDDLPVTFEVKSEPVDPDYEASPSPASTHSPAVMPIITLPAPRPRPQLKDVLPRLKQLQQMNASAPVNVIDELVKKNEFLLAKNDAGGYKPNSRKSRNQGDTKRPENLMETNPQTFLVSPTSQARISAMKPDSGLKTKDARYGKILRPRSPTRKCIIPEKDKSHFNYALIESNVKDKSSEKIFKVQKHEMVCAVTCKAMFMTQGGSFKGDFDLQFYWCNFCTFHTTNKSQLIQHGMEHRFHCKFCRYQSFSRSDIVHHSAKEHADAFSETASSMKYCILLSDYLQIYSQDTDEDRKKRAAPDDDDDEDDDEGPPQKTAKLDGRSVDSLSPDELKTLQNDYQIFDMDVENVDETDKNIESEEASPMASAAGDVPSDRQIIANIYEAPKTMNHIGNAEGSIQSVFENTMPMSGTAPIPVSLVAANNRPVLISRLSTPVVPVGQLIVPNIANTSIRPSAGIQPQLTSIAPSLLQTHRLMDSRPPPPPPTNKAKPGPGSSVSSSLYWSCGYCSFTSHSQSEIKEHSQKSHRGKPHRYVALIMPSDKQAQNGQNVEGAKDGKETNTTGKEIEIDNAEDLAESVPMESETESFKCFHCSFLVKKPELIKEHLFSKHASLSMVGVDIHSRRLKNIFYCPRDDCPFRSKSPAMFQSHVERCTPWQMKDLNIAVEKHLLDCLENTIKFSKAVQLKEQVSTNLGELSCIYCIFKSHFASRVKHHVMIKHPLKQMVIQAQSNRKGFSCLIYFCSLCSWHTRIKYRRKMHMLTAHNIENYDICDGSIQVYREDHLKKYFSTTDNVNNTFSCPTECDENVCSPAVEENTELHSEKVFPSEEDSNVSTNMLEETSDHFHTDKSNDTVYRCLFCFAKCTGLPAIKLHLQKIHPSQKMQAVHVEKCSNQEKCVFFLCPEELCTLLCAKETLLIEHAQFHESICVSTSILHPNDKTDTQVKTFTNKIKLTEQESKYVDDHNAPVILQDADVSCSKPVTLISALFSGHNTNTTDTKTLVLPESVNKSTLNTTLTASSPVISHTKQMEPGHSVVNTQTNPSSRVRIIAHAQSVPSSVGIGTTQNIPTVIADSLNPSYTSSSSSLMFSNVQSLPSVLPPCPGGIRIALCRTNFGVPTPGLYPQLGPTVMTNPPLAACNTSFSMISPSGNVASTAPTQLTTCITVPSVGGLQPLAVPGLVLAMVPPTPALTSTDNTIHVEILRVAEQGANEKLTPSPSTLGTCSQSEIEVKDVQLENSLPSNNCQPDSQEHDQKLKIESVSSLACNLDPGKEEIQVQSDNLVLGASPQLQLGSKPLTMMSGAFSDNKCLDDGYGRTESKMVVKTNIQENIHIQVEADSKVKGHHKQRSGLDVKTGKHYSEIKFANVKEFGKDSTLDEKDQSTGSINFDGCHIESCNSDEMTPNNSKEDGVVLAGKLKLRNSEMKKSQSVEARRFICKFCKFSVSEKVIAIKSHIVDNHPDEKFETYCVTNGCSGQMTCYLCPSDTCTFCFSEESVLFKHWMSVHEGEEEAVDSEKIPVSTQQKSDDDHSTTRQNSSDSPLKKNAALTSKRKSKSAALTSKKKSKNATLTSKQKSKDAPLTKQKSKDTPLTTKQNSNDCIVETKQNTKSSPKSKSKMGFECLYCDVSHVEPDLISMKKHYGEKHQEQDMIMRDLKVGTLRNSRIVVCSHKGCSFTSANPTDRRFQYHQLAHYTTKIYECSLCEWFSDDSCAATEHLISHSKKRNSGFLLEYSLKLQQDGNVNKTQIKSSRSRTVQ